jgi:hypothetical protein
MCTLHFVMEYILWRCTTFMFWKLYDLELLSCVQLRFVTLCHMMFTLCCFTLCSNIVSSFEHCTVVYNDMFNEIFFLLLLKFNVRFCVALKNIFYCLVLYERFCNKPRWKKNKKLFYVANLQCIKSSGKLYIQENRAPPKKENHFLKLQETSPRINDPISAAFRMWTHCSP